MKENMDHLTPIKKEIDKANAFHCYTGSISTCIDETNHREMHLYLSEDLYQIKLDKRTGSIVSPIYKITEKGLRASNLTLKEKLNKNTFDLINILNRYKKIIVQVEISKLKYTDFFVNLPKELSSLHYITLIEKDNMLVLDDSYIPTIPAIRCKCWYQDVEKILTYLNPNKIIIIEKKCFTNKRSNLMELFLATRKILVNKNDYIKVYQEFINNVNGCHSVDKMLIMNFGFVVGGFIATRRNGIKLYNHLLQLDMMQKDEYIVKCEIELDKIITNIRLIMMKICLTNYLNGIDKLCNEINRLLNIDLKIIEHINKEILLIIRRKNI